ncbi:MAG: hypothetical protein H0T47_17660 [Planctomycetaceae bacterium]|nr:hypothetical protein [Planctomycetaceae bacterium]
MNAPSHLVPLLLPVYDNEGRPFPRSRFEQVRRTLTEKFGGVTAYSRAPAEGHWKEADDATTRDDVVIYETMVDQLDRAWWSSFKEELRDQFQQEELIVRALPIELL